MSDTDKGTIFVLPFRPCRLKNNRSRIGQDRGFIRYILSDACSISRCKVIVKKMSATIEFKNWGKRTGDICFIDTSTFCNKRGNRVEKRNLASRIYMFRACCKNISNPFLISRSQVQIRMNSIKFNFQTLGKIGYTFENWSRRRDIEIHLSAFLFNQRDNGP